MVLSLYYVHVTYSHVGVAAMLSIPVNLVKTLFLKMVDRLDYTPYLLRQLSTVSPRKNPWIRRFQMIEP